MAEEPEAAVILDVLDNMGKDCPPGDVDCGHPAGQIYATADYSAAAWFVPAMELAERTHKVPSVIKG